jgi:hypothetical protein
MPIFHVIMFQVCTGCSNWSDDTSCCQNPLYVVHLTKIIYHVLSYILYIMASQSTLQYVVINFAKRIPSFDDNTNLVNVVTYSCKNFSTHYILKNPKVMMLWCWSKHTCKCHELRIWFRCVDQSTAVNDVSRNFYLGGQ